MAPARRRHRRLHGHETARRSSIAAESALRPEACGYWPCKAPETAPLWKMETVRHCRRPLRTYPSCSARSEEHTSELQSLMRISYAVFCLKKKKQKHDT